MLTNFKVLSLACKCVFYEPKDDAKGYHGKKHNERDPMEFSFERLEMHK